MAKKRTVVKGKPAKKPVARGASKGTSKPSRAKAAKAAPRTRATSKPAKQGTARDRGAGSAMGGPFPVSTGSGASVMDVAQRFMGMLHLGEEMGIYDALMDAGWASCEGVGVNLEWRGRDAVLEKGAQWMRENKIHGARMEGPFVGATGFSVRYEMDVETLATGERKHMTEVGVFTVREGKIVREEFMYFVG